MDVDDIDGETFIHKEVDEDKGLYQTCDEYGNIYDGIYGEGLMKKSKVESSTCIFRSALTDDGFADIFRASEGEGGGPP